MTLRVPILLYHGLAASDGGTAWTLPVAQFEAQLEAIRAAGCSPSSISELVDGLDGRAQLPARPLVITFDDGLEDFAALALPRLQAAGMPATLYVCAGLVGGTLEGRSVLNWNALREVSARGVEIGCHGWRHAELDALPRNALSRETRGAREQLQRALGVNVRSFAYPHGYHDVRVVEAVKEAGFDSAVAVKNAVSHAADQRFALARMPIGPETELSTFAGLCLGIGPLPRNEDALRTRGWRALRRAGRVLHLRSGEARA